MMDRRWKIMEKDLLEHGFSARCEGFRAALAGRNARLHSERCRARLEEAIGKDDPRVRDQNLRFNEFLDKAATREEAGERKSPHSKPMHK